MLARSMAEKSFWGVPDKAVVAVCILPQPNGGAFQMVLTLIVFESVFSFESDLAIIETLSCPHLTWNYRQQVAHQAVITFPFHATEAENNKCHKHLIIHWFILIDQLF